MKSERAKSVPQPITNQATECISELQEQIRARAYVSYEQRGRDNGPELDDWLKAESEVIEANAVAV